MTRIIQSRNMNDQSNYRSYKNDQQLFRDCVIACHGIITENYNGFCRSEPSGKFPIL